MAAVSYNIPELIEKTGEENVEKYLSSFSCPKNSEIENFVHLRALEFSKRRISITYLVFDEIGHFLAYFTLAHKAISIPVNSVSKTMARKLRTYSRFEESTNSFEPLAFLIAQFVKNYAAESNISGSELMEGVMMILQQIQTMIGGRIIFLECENEPKLLDFYQNDQNRFQLYGERYLDDYIEYCRLLKVL